MARNDNPFLMFHGDPYQANPFHMLGLPAGASQVVIDNRARACEDALACGVQLGGTSAAASGEPRAAAGALRSPVLRAMFALMLLAEREGD